MSSKKVSFESRDPSHVADAASNERKVDGDTPTQKASFQSTDLTDDSGLTLETTQEDDGNISEKASFYAKDPGLGTTDVSKKTKKKYMGPERRKEDRRKTQDRRNDVRFDLNNTDRRKSEGRREDDHTPKFW